jgi:vanillate O-demethylase monooxygenase subunit
VRAFPALERHGLVFLWMGDAALADPASLVRIEQYGQSGWGVSRGYKMFGCSLRLIMENLIDPAHTSFVHQRTIGNDAGNDIPLETRVLEDGTIECGRWICGSPPVPIVKRFAQPPGNVDRWQYYYVKPPCTSLVDFGSLNTGLPHTPAEQAKAPYRVLSYAFLTPQDDRSTHYFSLQLRNFAAEDLSVTQELEQMYQATFEEDRVLLEAIQEAEDADPEARPVLIASDAGVVRLRRAAAAQE